MKSAIQRWGNSLAVRIPKAIALEAELSEGASVDLKLEDGKVVLVPLRPQRYTLDQMLEEITDDNLHKEFDTGSPEGRESW